jgi:MFS family permease
MDEPEIRKALVNHGWLSNYVLWCYSARLCPASYVIFTFPQHDMVLTQLLVAMYIIARMLLGVGIVFAIISGSSLIGELGYPKERPYLTSLFNASYFTTNIAGNWSWRVPSLLQIVPSLLQVIFVL